MPISQFVQLAQWRTWSGSIIIGLMMVAVLWLVPSEARAGVAPVVIGGLGTLGIGLAAKSFGEHKVNAEAAVKASPPAATILAAGAKE